MKTRTITMIALAAATLGGGAFFAGQAMAQPSPSAPVATTVERHPEIHKALRQLDNAYTTMQNAADDFGGHKKKAMEMTEAARAELRAALKFDRH